MSNVYFSYKYTGDFSVWSELFGSLEEDKDVQKRALAIISGGVLPVVALGFIKSLVDYIRPASVNTTETVAPITQASEPVHVTENIETEQVENIQIEESPEQQVITVDEEIVTEPERDIDSAVNMEKELSENKVKEVITKKVKIGGDHYSMWKKNV